MILVNSAKLHPKHNDQVLFRGSLTTLLPK